jgi:long-chain acyl-CoA synthetase
LLDAMTVFGCEMVQTFGMTEASGAIAQLDPADHSTDDARRHLLQSAGKPFPWVELKVVDPATSQEPSAGTPGEIWIKSRQNFLGYYNDPDQSHSTLTSDGWLRSGDVGTIEDGYIFLRDRLKDVVITGGENVYPGEVERVLGAHPHVVEVAVIGTPSDRWGETVTAIVVPRAGSAVEAEELIAFARGHLAGFKCPTTVQVVEQLPRNATGKIRKDLLRAPFWEGKSRNIH